MAKLSNKELYETAVEDNMARPEIVYANVTTEDMFSADTSGDPSGSEERAKPDMVQMPAHFYRKYAINGEGLPSFNQLRVNGIMDVLKAKKDTEYSPLGKNDEEKTMNKELFDMQVESLALSFNPLLEIDPQTTGINFLQLTTRTWAEFVSIAYEYSESVDSLTQDQEMPTWLIDREDKMFNLGRKARLLTAVVNKIDSSFGLSDVRLNEGRVKTEVERRQQRLAEWNYKNSADASRKVSETYNAETVAHCKSVFDAA